jgi:hypothetical protein
MMSMAARQTFESIGIVTITAVGLALALLSTGLVWMKLESVWKLVEQHRTDFANTEHAFTYVFFVAKINLSLFYGFSFYLMLNLINLL